MASFCPLYFQGIKSPTTAQGLAIVYPRAGLVAEATSGAQGAQFVHLAEVR